MEENRSLIQEAGRIPVERDTLYHRVVREAGRWSATEPIPTQLNSLARKLRSSSPAPTASFRRWASAPPIDSVCDPPTRVTQTCFLERLACSPARSHLDFLVAQRQSPVGSAT